MRTNVYIDGFNLYYGCRLKQTPYRWLDLERFCRTVLPNHLVIQRVRYFTALVAGPAAAHQQLYLRALRTLPSLTIHEGQFLAHPRVLPLAAPPAAGLPSGCVGRAPSGPTHAYVIKPEEKGSDVNLATLLLCDGYENDYDVAVVISNDSDLTMPIEVVRRRLTREIGVIYPHRSLNPHLRPSVQLTRAASFIRQIRRGALAGSQLPSTLADAAGSISRPPNW